MALNDCLLSQGRELAGTCVKNNVGGIKKVWLANFSEVTGTTITTLNDLTYTGSTEAMVADIQMESGAFFYIFDTVKETSSFSEAITVNIQNGTLSFVPTITLIFNKLDAETRNTIQMLATSLLIAIVEDANGKRWIFGLDQGLDLTAVESTSGVALADRNGSTLTFTGAEFNAAREIYTTDIDPVNAIIEFLPNGVIEVNNAVISSY